MRERVTRSGDRIRLGEIEFPVQEIRNVDVILHAPRRFLIACGIGLSIFVLTLVFGVVSFTIDTSNSSSTGWALVLIFLVGAIIAFGTLIFAMIAFPMEWRVHIVTAR